MKKLYRKNTVHPSPPLVSDKLAFLPAAILAITAALSPDDQEALAYLISCSSSSGNFSSANNRATTSSSSDCADHPPSFNCYCFNCYMSYWVKWDSSPNRQLIHQVIDAYEDGLQNKTEKSRGKKRRKNNKDSAGEKKSEVVVGLNVEDSGEPNTAEESPNSGGAGGDEEEEEKEDGYGEERGAVRRFVSFLGERLWGVWA